MLRPTPRISDAELRRLRRRLEAERRRLAADYTDDRQRERAITRDEVGDVVDRAEAVWHREELLAAAEDDLERLRLVEDALWRMSEGTYGTCLIDGEPIPLERLRAVPWARFCTAHQEEWEARHPAVEPLPAHASS